MKKRTVLSRALFVLLSIVIVLELVALAVPAAEPALSLVHADRERDWYVNRATLVSPRPGLVSFWNTIVPGKESSLLLRAKGVLREAGRSGSRIAYIQALQEIDCRTGRERTWNIVVYDRRDRILHAESSPREDVVQAMLGRKEGMVRESVCREQGDEQAVRVARLITGPGEE